MARGRWGYRAANDGERGRTNKLTSGMYMVDENERFKETFLQRHGNLFGMSALYLVSFLVLHTGLVSSFGGCMAQASYFDTARRLASFLAKKTRFVTTSKVRSCHKAEFGAARALI